MRGRAQLDPLEGAARDGERLVARTRLVVLAATAVLWPTSHLLTGQPLAARVPAIGGAAAVGALASWLMLRHLRAHPPTRAFSLASVTLDVAFVAAALLSVILEPFPGYPGVVLLSSTPAVYLVVAAAGVRFSRAAAAWGIVVGGLAMGGLIALDAHLWEGPYGPTVGNVIGVAFNLLAASVVAWSVGARTRALADGVRALGRLTARTRHRLGAYLPPEVVAASLHDDALLRAGHRAEVTMLFARLVSTAELEASSPDRYLDELNAYLGALTEAVHAQGGIIDKYLANGVMAVFGVPRELPDPSARALGSAEAMERALEALNRRREAEGRRPLDHRIGIHRGPVVVGNVGTARRVSFTVVGDAVNVAARVQGLAVEHGERVVATHAVRDALEVDVDPSQWVALGAGPLRGRRAQVELLAWRPGDVPSYPAPPSTAVPPRSALPGSEAQAAWEGASPRSRLALREAPQQLGDVVLTEARVTSERVLAWTRFAITALAFVLAPYFVSGDAPELPVWSIRGLSVVAMGASLLLLRRLRHAPPSNALALATLALDLLLATLAILLFAVWPHPSYPGVLRLPGVGLLHLVVVLGGLRVRTSHALFAAVAGPVCLAALLAVDGWLLGLVPSLPNVVSGYLVLAGSGALGFAIATRTERLLSQTHEEALRAAKARERLGAYLSEAVAAHAVGEERLELGGRRLGRVAVLFCDLRGFTAMAEGLSPEEVVARLNGYFDAMAVPIEEHRGVIDSFLGDAITIVFGAPEPRDDAPARAVRAALGMRRALAAHNAQHAPPLAHGIGLHLGPAVAGHVGTADRAAYTVLGDVVTVAEQLEGATKTRHADIALTVELRDAALALDPSLDLDGEPFSVETPTGSLTAIALQGGPSPESP